MENEEDLYTPVEPNFYNYTALNKLVNNIDNRLFNNIEIKINAYEIKNNSKCPYLKYLLIKDELYETMFFPELKIITNDLNSENAIILSKVKLFNLLGLNNYSEFDKKICFKGFYLNKKEVHIVFDLTDCNLQISDIYRMNKLWFSLLDEIINQKNVCNFLVDTQVTNFFINNSDFIFLKNKNGDNYELPVIGYIGINDINYNKINFIYTFGTPTKDKNAILGAYYYFTDYKNAIREGGWSETGEQIMKNGKRITGAIVRFALFLGKMKIVENLLNDENDISEIKKEMINDTSLDQNMEILTMRISDHDGKWTEKYDSVFLGKIELDNGGYFKNAPIFALKEYEQQIPLSYHFIDKSYLQEKYCEKDNYLIM